MPPYLRGHLDGLAEANTQPIQIDFFEFSLAIKSRVRGLLRITSQAPYEYAYKCSQFQYSIASATENKSAHFFWVAQRDEIRCGTMGEPIAASVMKEAMKGAVCEMSSSDLSCF